MSKSKNVLFKMTGSIACYKACNVISALVKKGHAVQTMCSENALNFIGKTTLEGLTGRTVLSGMFSEKAGVRHIELAEWADLAVICPATGNIINKLAAGIADDYVSTSFLSFDLKKPYLIFPAMNERMYLHPATLNSIKKLKGWGVKVFEPERGRQACGSEGKGRLMEPERILAALEKYL